MKYVIWAAMALATLPAYGTILNGDFESPAGFGPATGWVDTDTAVLGYSHCTVGTCFAPASATPHAGNGWIWFGGSSGQVQTAVLEQSSVVLPVGTAAVDFFFYIGIATGDASMTFSIDGTPLFNATSADISTYSAYQRVSIPLGAFADGGLHTLRFDYVESELGTINFNLDDVSVTAVPEPATLTTCALGLAVIVGAAVRRRRSRYEVTPPAVPVAPSSAPRIR
jgi:MYXO-CTERM domain-containing protein